MKLLYYPDKFLEKNLDHVDIDTIDIDLVETKKHMTELMLKHRGVGLSANQVGIDVPLFVMGNDKSNIVMVVNPVIKTVSETSSIHHEGCLSFPGIYVNVKRPNLISVMYWDENLEKHEISMDGYSARVFLHEYDHLNGITFRNRVSKLRWDMAVKKKNKKYTNGR